MRLAIWDYLTEHCQSIQEWKQPYMADKTTNKPYGVIVLGEELRAVGNQLGTFRSLYIWPYVGGRNYLTLDAAVREIRKLLSGVTLTTTRDNRFTIEWVNEGRDFWDVDLEAMTRRLEFRIPRLAPR